MKKLLIYYPESCLSPKGGPAGYLYNLKSGLEKIGGFDNGSFQISFYGQFPTGLENNAGLKKRIPKRILEIRRALNDAVFVNKSFPVDDSMHEYDMIHFHSTEKMYLCRNFLKDYQGKVLLTSHAPCGIYKERIDKLNPFDYKLLKKKIDRLEELDRYAFERADYIIFPCEEAEEPYFNTWKRYASLRVASKYRYMTTGIMPCTAKVPRSQIRQKYGIPEDAFLISYAGRHNEIKGYGDLKKIGEKMLADKDVYFLIAGVEGPIYRLKNDRWIEVGWTNDPHSLIAASDVFVLPNHETYFDLVLLEVISLGIPMVLSETGGNKYFKRYQSDGFLFYRTVEEAVLKLKTMKAKTPRERAALGADVKRIFDQDFTVETFAENYIKTIGKIAND